AVTVPSGFRGILTQFIVVMILGHIGLRVLAPRASRSPYAVAMLLTAIGLAFVARLAPDVAQDQSLWVTIGVAVMLGGVVVGQRYRRLRQYRYTAALIAVLLLLATGIFGDTINGARLWITVAGQTVQTTELIKIFMLIFLAGYLADSAGVLSAPRLTFGGRSYSALPYLVPLGLILLVAVVALGLLKDLGTIALLLLVTIGALYVATGRLAFVAGGFALLAITGLVGYQLFDHVETRIDVWLHPFDDALATGYQTSQALFAIEAGGVTGEGLGRGSPDVIPAVPTDYIFSAIGEELGLAGALGIVLLFVLLLFSGLRIAVQAPDEYGRLLALSMALLIAVMAFVIIAGNLGLIPTTGITLPFVSYGGSSLVVNFALIGILLGISDASAKRVGDMVGQDF
ncbi:MAG: FtsW/RodA/SpoVE family cell cycle protein, partial [Anaerolineales bacterium]